MARDNAARAVPGIELVAVGAGPERGRPRRGRPGHDLGAVLAAAVGLFNERGFEATSMDDVARRLGITKSSLYHHVAGKQELFHRMVRHVFSAMPTPDPSGAWDDRVRA